METVYVYTLSDPRTGVIYYVGSTSKPTRREMGHYSLQCSPYMRGWMDELKAQNLRPTLMVVAETAEHNRIFEERRWITYYWNRGEPLLNGYMRPENRVCRGCRFRWRTEDDESMCPRCHESQGVMIGGAQLRLFIERDMSETERIYLTHHEIYGAEEAFRFTPTLKVSKVPIDTPLRRWRLAHGYHRPTIAVRCEIGEEVLTAYEQGYRIPQGHDLAILLKHTGLPREALQIPDLWLKKHPDFITQYADQKSTTISTTKHPFDKSN